MKPKTTEPIRVRIPKDGPLLDKDVLILKGRKGKERRLTPDKWWLNRNTPVGEDADLYEEKPYGGRRYVPWKEVIAVERIKEDYDRLTRYKAEIEALG